MTRKIQATSALTEMKRTYEIELFSGGIIFKYYTPSEMKAILENRVREHAHRANTWKRIKMVGHMA